MTLKGIQQTILSQAASNASQTRTDGTNLPSKAGGKNSTKAVVGDLVGNIFYGTLIKQMQASSIKGPYLHGGRAEEVFQGQLGMELAKRLGEAPGNPLTDKIYQAITKRFGLKPTAVNDPVVTQPTETVKSS